MIGEAAGDSERVTSRKPGAAALEARGLSVFEIEGRRRVKALNLIVRKGEVVGLFGLLGAGCVEAALAIYGAWKGKREGTILIDGRGTGDQKPGRGRGLGLGLMAQDRRDCLIGDQSIGDNIGIASLDKIVRHGMLDVAEGRQARPRTG